MTIAYYLDTLAPRYDALVVANGIPPRKPLLKRLQQRAEHVVAFDGGLNVLFRYGLAPDHVVGDLDSATPEALDWAVSQGAKVHRRPSVDEPDFLKGLNLCRELGYKRVVATGMAGGRLDHVLAAVYFSLNVRGIEMDLVTDEVVVIPLRGAVERRFHIPPGHTISWFAAPEAGPCSLAGVRWPFRNRLLRPQGFYSLSNQPAAGPIVLKQKAGHSIFVISLLPQTSE